jgi:hypothetical protein
MTPSETPTRRRPLGLRVRRIPRSLSMDGSPGRAERDDAVVEWPWLPGGRVVGATLVVALVALVTFADLPAPLAGTEVALALLATVVVYAVTAFCLNSTRLTLTGTVIAIDHGPVPWPGRRRVDIAGTTQLFVRRQRLTRQTASYELCASAGASRAPTLIIQADHDVVSYLEQELEALLGITDAPVDGEFGRQPPPGPPQARVVRGARRRRGAR